MHEVTFMLLTFSTANAQVVFCPSTNTTIVLEDPRVVARIRSAAFPSPLNYSLDSGCVVELQVRSSNAHVSDAAQ